MRHGKKFNHLGRKKAHRRAMLSNMANSLIEHKRISTTVAKAKALRVYVEPIINKSKDDSTHSRRIAFRYLQSKDSVTTLFREVGPKVMDRPGGYTRIIKTGYRKGDGADMCMIELVDFNELYSNATTKKKRSRRGGGKKVQNPVTDVVEKATETVTEAKDDVVDAVKDVAESTEKAVDDAKDQIADNNEGEDKPKDEA